MREILFRGKTEGEEWVKGDLLQVIIKGLPLKFIIPHGISCEKNEKISVLQIEVKPETVGQLLYTDKKNNNYFDGDIFEHNYYPDCLCRVYFSEDLLAVVGQIYDKNGEYELFTILPSDFENNMKLVGSVH